MEPLAEELKRLRHAHRMTQEAVAEHLGITQPAYSDYERGRKIPPLERLVRLSRLYGAPIERLIVLLPAAQRPKGAPATGQPDAAAPPGNAVLSRAVLMLDRLQAELQHLRQQIKDALGGGESLILYS